MNISATPIGVNTALYCDETSDRKLSLIDDILLSIKPLFDEEVERKELEVQNARNDFYKTIKTLKTQTNTIKSIENDITTGNIKIEILNAILLLQEKGYIVGNNKKIVAQTVEKLPSCVSYDKLVEINKYYQTIVNKIK